MNRFKEAQNSFKSGGWMETKMVVKSVTMPPDMAARLELRAERERRSFAQIVRMLIEKAERGDPYPAIPEAPCDCDREE